jgi:hypothetical protein
VGPHNSKNLRQKCSRRKGLPRVTAGRASMALRVGGRWAAPRRREMSSGGLRNLCVYVSPLGGRLVAGRSHLDRPFLGRSRADRPET